MTNVTLFASDKGDIKTNLAFVNNLGATVDPTVNNDISQGYTVGSQWINTVDKKSFICMDQTKGAAVWQIDSEPPAGTGSAVQQGAPTAKTVSSTMTAADMLAGIITVLQGAGAASAQQLPLATAMDTALPAFVANDAFDFSVINTSATAAEAASITTNTGWTLVGDMDIQANSAATTKSAGRFRARKTAAGAWTLYRIS